MQLAVEKNHDQDAQVFIGRQPILDRELNTRAYELLFRPECGNEADFLDGEKATAQVIYNAILEIGLTDLVGTGLAYINFTRDSLLNNFASLLPPERVVLEVLEDVEMDDSLVQSINAHVENGYSIALDDFVYDPKWEPLIEQAAVIKFDIRALSDQSLQEQLRLIKKHKVKLLAEKVETQEEFERLREMGFDYFQGYFFARPKIISKNKLPGNHIALLNMIARLQDPEIEIEEVENLVSQNISLSYKLLRYINSASYSFSKKIDSIRQVVIYFGLQRLKNWASLIAMTDIDDKPSELLQTGLVRAKMCELLAVELGRAESDSYFMLGLFSILDALMDSTMQDVLDKLPISENMAAALKEQKGELGEVLGCCLALEQNDWSEMGLEGVEDRVINTIYMEAMIWSRRSSQGMARTK